MGLPGALNNTHTTLSFFQISTVENLEWFTVYGLAKIEYGQPLRAWTSRVLIMIGV